MLDSLARRPRLHPIAGRLAQLPWLAAAVRRGGGLPTVPEVRAVQRAEREAAERSALLRLAQERDATAPPHDSPVSLALAERLPHEVRDRLMESASADPRWRSASPGQRAVELLQAAMQLEDADAIAATDLRPHLPPEDVHAMARGPHATAEALGIADLVVDSLHGAGAPLRDGDTVLDFGCSSGRIVAPLAAWRAGIEWIGCDPNRAAIAWAADNVPGGRFFLNDAPPLDGLASSSVDAAFAVSIWSHFAPSAALEWLAELHRVVKPGGRLFLSAHGSHSLGLYQRVYRETAGRFGLGDDHVLEAQTALAQNGWWWWDSFGEAGDWGVRDPTWGHAHYLPEWILGHVTPDWAVSLYREGALLGNQDVYVLTRQ